MSRHTSFSDLEYARKKRQTRRDVAHCMRDLAGTHIRTLSGSAWRWTICPHIIRARHTKFSPRLKHIAPFSVRSFVTHPNAPVGATWWKSKSVCCAVTVWIAASANAKSSSLKSTRGSDNATPAGSAPTEVRHQQSTDQAGTRLSRHSRGVKVTVRRYAWRESLTFTSKVSSCSGSLPRG